MNIWDTDLYEPRTADGPAARLEHPRDQRRVHLPALPTPARPLIGVGIMLLALGLGLISAQHNRNHCAPFIHTATVLRQRYDTAKTAANGNRLDPQWNRTWMAWAELFANDTTGCASGADKAQAQADLATHTG